LAKFEIASRPFDQEKLLDEKFESRNLATLFPKRKTIFEAGSVTRKVCELATQVCKSG
jgi:hypothetical protein